MKLNKELAKQAKNHGICKEWHADLKSTEDIEKMLDMYLKGIDFCLSNDYPKNDFIRANFKGKMEHKGIHLDERLNVVNERKVVCLGNCFGTVETDSFHVSEVFVKNGSEIIITARGNSFVMIDMFDDSQVTVYVKDNAKVCINHYGGDFFRNEDNNGMIKVIEKYSKTY